MVSKQDGREAEKGILRIIMVSKQRIKTACIFEPSRITRPEISSWPTGSIKSPLSCEGELRHYAHQTESRTIVHDNSWDVYMSLTSTVVFSLSKNWNLPSCDSQRACITEKMECGFSL